MKMNFDKILNVLINKFHIILGTLAQAAIFVYHYRADDPIRKMYRTPRWLGVRRVVLHRDILSPNRN